jgi:hypothetical protein
VRLTKNQKSAVTVCAHTAQGDIAAGDGETQQDRYQGSMASRSFEIAQMRNIGLGTLPGQLQQTILVYGSSQVRRQFNFANDL